MRSIHWQSFGISKETTGRYQALAGRYPAPSIRGLVYRDTPATDATERDVAKPFFPDVFDRQPWVAIRYRLLSVYLRPSGSPLAEPGSWGPDYVRHLGAELETSLDTVDLLEESELVDEIAQPVDYNVGKIAFSSCERQKWLRTLSENLDEGIVIEDEFSEDLQECFSNTRMNGYFRDFDKAHQRKSAVPALNLQIF
ncbi:hypothetical protein B0H19DRAFT_1085396 [Mycena capillaripes]|nr:hypothetical protein B0H19DRAFT_1085396 [Mycena capillaripes]